MARFDRQIATAKRLIAKNGQDVYWRVVRNVENVSEPWKPSATDTEDIPVKICFLPDTKEQRETVRYIAETEVAAGSVIGLMGQVDFEPSSKDVVIRDGVECRIKTVNILSPNGQIVLYTIEFEA